MKASDYRRDRPHAGSFLTRLRKCQSGNVLPMMAAAIVPMAGMVGSGLDISRAYMTKAKLQTACDSAALATRRFMGGSAFSAAAEAEGEKFFDFNFPEGTMGTPEVDLEIGVNATDTDVVEVTASTQVPTSIMRIFGKENMDVAVSCNADQDFVHNDIMLVLDVTGSMYCAAGTGDGCVYQATEQNNSRLDALRTAAAALYRALATADEGVQTRYGFMPYSMTVNVRNADDTDGFNTSWLRTTSPYWVRSGSNNVRQNVTHNATWFANSWGGCIEERATISRNAAAAVVIGPEVAQADIDTVSTTNDKLKWHPYDPVTNRREEFPPSPYNNTSVWPNNLRWFCPAPARKLEVYDTEAEFQEQLEDSIALVGGTTNHDLGITWGMRYLSRTGMFSDDNPTEINDMRVDQHLVFLTDGSMTSYGFNYSAYGMPSYTNLWSSSGVTEANLKAKHQARFLNACNRARQMGMTVWVIALDAPSSDISSCASGSDHYFEADDSDSLEDAFDTIGKEIGKLRLTR
jgi:hypothetical protein